MGKNSIENRRRCGTVVPANGNHQRRSRADFIVHLMKAKLKRKLFLFHWEKDGAMARAAELNAEGWRVEMEYEEGSRGCKNLKAFGPDVVVFDIAQKAVH